MMRSYFQWAVVILLARYAIVVDAAFSQADEKLYLGMINQAFVSCKLLRYFNISYHHFTHFYFHYYVTRQLQCYATRILLSRRY
jgi:hypothetical protein